LILHSGRDIIFVEAARDWGPDPEPDLRGLVHNVKGKCMGAEVDDYISPTSIQNLDNPEQEVGSDLSVKPHPK
jgi:hypothetical protein